MNIYVLSKVLIVNITYIHISATFKSFSEPSFTYIYKAFRHAFENYTTKTMLEHTSLLIFDLVVSSTPWTVF